MASVNKVILIGNLGDDPTLSETTAGRQVSNMKLATNRFYKDANGNPQKTTQWHRVVVWGKMAENCKEFLYKGRQVYVEGRLETKEWTDSQGVKRHTTEVHATNVQFLSHPNRDRYEDDE